MALGLACLLALTTVVQAGAALQGDQTGTDEPKVTLTGLRTGVTYWPTRQDTDYVPSAEVSPCLPECRTVPANEWLRVVVSTTPFAKLGIRGCYQDCLESIGTSSAIADELGRAYAILPPVRSGEKEFVVYVQERGGEATYSYYAVAGSLPTDPREISIEPLNEWARLNFSVEADGEYFVAIRLEQYPFLTDIHPEHREAPAAAIFTDVEGTRKGQKFASTRWFFASNDMDPQASVATSTIGADLRVSSMDTPAGNNAANALSIQGVFSPGELSIHAVIARAGGTGGPPVRLVAFSPSGTGIKVDVLETGPFIAVAPTLQSGVQAGVAATGPMTGTLRATAQVNDDGMVFAGVRTGVDGATLATIGYGDATISRNLGPLQTLMQVRDGPCAGLWSATASASSSFIGSVEAMVAHADGLVLSEFARSTFGAGADCEL